MKFRLGSLCLLLTLTIAFAGDGIPARGSVEDYSAHQVSGKIAIGAAYVSPAQVKKLFGEDLDKRGYVVFEVGMFPSDAEADVSPDDFKLKSKEGSVTRSATPHMVATDAHPQQSTPPALPGKVHVQTVDTVGYEHGSYGRGGVYTDTSVAVSNYPTAPNPPPPARNGNGGLEQRLDEKSLPDIKTRRAVAGYVFFPKPANDKRTEYELLYAGTDGQVSLKLVPAK
jgi:hypothetical protein